MDVTDTLIAFITDQKYIRQKMNPALLEQLHIVNRTFGLVDANDPAGLTVHHDLVFDRVTFVLA